MEAAAAIYCHQMPNSSYPKGRRYIAYLLLTEKLTLRFYIIGRTGALAGETQLTIRPSVIDKICQVVVQFAAVATYQCVRAAYNAKKIQRLILG